MIDRPAGPVARIGRWDPTAWRSIRWRATLITVYTTFPDRETAARVARALVEERLAACANLLPVESIYRWRGGSRQAGEWAVFLKTRRDLYPAIEARLRALHPYEVPAILGSPDERVDAAYAAWVRGVDRPGRLEGREPRRVPVVFLQLVGLPLERGQVPPLPGGQLLVERLHLGERPRRAPPSSRTRPPSGLELDADRERGHLEVRGRDPPADLRR